MVLEELTESQIQKMSNEEIMEIQLKQSMSLINMSIEKTKNYFINFIGIFAIALAFIFVSYKITLIVSLPSLIFLFLSWKSNQHTILKLMSHKMLISFLISKKIANSRNYYIIEKYNIDKYKTKNNSENRK